MNLSSHKEVIGFLTDDQEFADHDAIRSEADKAFYNVKTGFAEIEVNIARSVDRTAAPSTPKLPKIRLPIFDGDFKSWPSFFDLYNTLIHFNNTLSNIEKFHYLTTSIVKEPLSLIKSVPLTDDNYIRAYETLKKRYQNRRYLASNYYHEIFNSSAIIKPTSEDLRKLIDTFSENLAALRALKFPVDNWDFLLFNTLLQKLNTKTRTEFELRYSHVDLPTYQQLISFLEEYCRAFESVQLANSSSLKLKLDSNKPAKHIQSFNIELKWHFLNYNLTFCTAF